MNEIYLKSKNTYFFKKNKKIKIYIIEKNQKKMTD